jgi:autotransporter-associated beta strand protein
LAINSTNDLGAPNFLLNQLNLTGADVTLWGNSLNFIANGAVLPQLLQNSTGPITVNPGLILSNNLTFAGASTSPVTVNGAITGTGGLILNGPYTLALTTANAYTGPTTVSNGTLFIQADNNLGAVAGGTITVAALFSSGTPSDRARSPEYHP